MGIQLICVCNLLEKKKNWDLFFFNGLCSTIWREKNCAIAWYTFLKYSPFNTFLIVPKYSTFIALESYLIRVFYGAFPVFVTVISWLNELVITYLNKDHRDGPRDFLDFLEGNLFWRVVQSGSLPLTAHIVFWSPC